MVDFNRFSSAIDLLAEDIESTAFRLRLIKVEYVHEYKTSLSRVERELLKVCEKLQTLKLELD